jgi:hypothetical protein
MYSTHSPLKVGFRESASQCVYVKVRPLINKVQLFRSDHNDDDHIIADRDITLPLQPPDNLPYFPAFAADVDQQWYQMHIQASGPSVHVWLRKREIGGSLAALWTSVLYISADSQNRTVLDDDHGPQEYFSINVENGMYAVDNIVLTKRQALGGGSQ